MRYLITFACYGSHLQGDSSGSVDRAHNVPGSRMLGEDPGLAACVRRQMKSERYVMAPASGTAVLDAIREVCAHRGWTLFAAHVRTNHVHAVVEADVRPEEILNDWKAYASRRLNFVEEAKRPRWARHGSTRWLWKDQDVRDAIKYVAEDQGEPMALFVANLL